jgi:hypothetical protein
MRKVLLALGLLVLLAVPAAATAKPDQGEKRAAKQQCKAERGTSKATHAAFRAKYGSPDRCERKKAAEEEAENEAAHKNAAKECKAERTDPEFAETHGDKTFDEFYGTNENLKNAYGKCVSSKAKAHKDDMDAKDQDEVKRTKRAAKECAAERGKLGIEDFATEYGTDKHGRNAFGKCVSAKTQESDE